MCALANETNFRGRFHRICQLVLRRIGSMRGEIQVSDPMKKAKTSGSNAGPNPNQWDRLVGEGAPLARSLAEDMKRLESIGDAKFKVPTKTRIIAVANQKGGVGKTTSAVNLAAALASGGLRVLVIDDDPQGNASTALGAERNEDTLGLYNVLTREVSFFEILQQSKKLPGLYIAPSSINLALVDVELVEAPDRSTRLRETLYPALEELAEQGERFDYVIIDCPPSMSLLPINALIAAHEVLIPVQTEYYALEGLTQLLRTIEGARDGWNAGLRVSTILLTMASKNTNLSAEVSENVRDFFPEETLSVEIPRSVRIAESPSYGETVITYAPRSSGAIAYLAAAHELADRAE